MTEVRLLRGRAAMVSPGSLRPCQPDRFATALDGDAGPWDGTGADRVGAPIRLSAAPVNGVAACDAILTRLRADGVRCLIAPGFRPAFAAAARQYRLLTIGLAADDVAALRLAARRGQVLTVDLVQNHVTTGGSIYPFRLDRFTQRCLLDGLDDLARSFDSATADAIDRFEGGDLRRRPWATPA